MGLFFSKGYSDAITYEDKFSRSLRIEGQVAVADLEVDIVAWDRKRDPDKVPTVQVRLDFSNVSDTQMLLWAARTKMADIHRAMMLNCSVPFLQDLFKQGPVCCPASTAENIFIDPEVGRSFGAPKLIEEYAAGEYVCFLCLSTEGQEAVIDFAVHNCYSSGATILSSPAGDYNEVWDSQIRLNFSDVSDTQLLLWAARTKMIDVQRALYRSGEIDEQFLNDLVNQGRPVYRHASEAGLPFDDTARKQQHVMTSVQNMSAEDRAQLIKLLQQMDK